MKYEFFFIIFILFMGFAFLSCNSKESSKQNVVLEKEAPSMILSKELKEILPELFNIQDSIHKINGNKINNRIYPFVRFLVTNNFVYAHISNSGCTDRYSAYVFEEEIIKDSTKIEIYIDVKSQNPERYFDLNDLLFPDEKQRPIIEDCEDWYWVKAKFKRIKAKLKLEKVSTFLDNSYSEETFYDKSDSFFLTEIGVLIPEPQHPKSLE